MPLSLLAPTRNRHRLRRLPNLIPEIQLFPASHHSNHSRLLRDDNLRHDGAAQTIAVLLQRVPVIGFEHRDWDPGQVAAGPLDEVPGEEEGGRSKGVVGVLVHLGVLAEEAGVGGREGLVRG